MTTVVEQHGSWGLKVIVRSTFLHAELDDEMDGNQECGRDSSLQRRRAASLPVGRRSSDHQPVIFRHSRAAAVAGGGGSGARGGCGGWTRPDGLPKAALPPTCEADRPWQSGESATTASGGSPATVGFEGTPVMNALGSSGRHAKQAERARTTAMMRNVPTKYSRRSLLDLITAEGFQQEVDFLYFPVNFRTGFVTGFAFVNLVTPAAAQLFRAHFHGFSKWGVRTGRVCNVSWARDHQQGLEANMERFRNSGIMHASVAEEHKPLVLSGGAPVSFPGPTKQLTPPRR